jgi:hypothetical protein
MSKITIGRGPWLQSVVYGFLVSLVLLVITPFFLVFFTLAIIIAPLLGLAGFIRLEREKRYLIKMSDDGYYGGVEEISRMPLIVRKSRAVIFSQMTAEKKAKEIGGVLEEVR